MAIHLDQNMFNLGAVKLDSNPSVNMYAQIQARRENQRIAKEDAFKDYINNLNTKITPTGVRVADLPAFEDLKNKWMEYGLKNKDALIKNDIAAQTEFNRLYQPLINLTTRSKSEEERKKPFVEVLVDPNKRKNTSSKLIEDLHNHDQPLFTKDKDGNWVENRGRKSLDYAENYFNPQLDFDKEFTGWSKGQERGKTYGDIVKTDPVTGQVTVATEEKFAPEQIQQIADNAMKGVADQGEANNYYRHKLENIKPADEEKLNKAFQSVYGKGTEYVQPDGKIVKADNLIDSPEELAAAEAILQAQSMVKKGEERALNRKLADERAINKIYINQAGREGSGGSQQITGNEFDRIEISKVPNWVGKTPGEKHTGAVTLRVSDMPARIPAILKAAGIDLENYPQYEADVKDGVIQSITPIDESGKKWNTVTRSDMENAQLKYNSEPQKGQQPTFGDKNQPKPTQYKKEIKRSEIKAKAAQAGHTVKEYEAILKKNGVKIID